MHLLYSILFLFAFSFFKANAESEKTEGKGSDVYANTRYFNSDNPGDGSYKFSFETSNNIERSESGKLDEDGNYVVQGTYSFIADDGKKYFVTFVADKNGYHPTVLNEEDTDTELEALPIPMVPQAGVPPQVVASLLG